MSGDVRLRTPEAGNRTRSRILDMGVEEFARDGVHGVSVARLAMRGRMSKAGLLRHHSSKVALLEAVARARV